MSLPLSVLLVDLAALLAVAAGFLLAFRQRTARRWLRRLFAPRRADPPPARPRDRDPAHYAMIIAGVMLMAFGVLMALFTTAYELMTAAPG